VVDHGWVAQSTVDWRRHRQEGSRARWHAHRSRASGCSGARELTGGGGKWRAKHGLPVLGLTGAQWAVWWPVNGDEVVAEEKLGCGSTQASVEGEMRWGRCGEIQWRCLPFIGVVRQ
jgi:hypothetical protein